MHTDRDTINAFQKEMKKTNTGYGMQDPLQARNESKEHKESKKDVETVEQKEI